MDLKELRKEVAEYLNINDRYSDVDDFEDDNKGKGVDIYLRVNTLDFSKEQYEEWQRVINNMSWGNENYDIYFFFDGGAYEYWTEKQEESNYLGLTLYIKDSFTEDDLPQALADLQKAIDWYDKEEYRILTGYYLKESAENLKTKLKKAITESYEEEEILDPLFKVGSIVTIGITDDDDLNDALEELGDPEIVITDIEDDNFWGKTVDGQDIDFHMEYKDISSIRPGELKEDTDDRWREELKGLEWKYAESDKYNHANFVYCNIPLVYSSADLYVYAPDAKHSTYWAMIVILHGGKREYDMFKVEGCASAEEAVAKFKEEIMKKFDVTCELRPIPAEMIEKMEANKIVEEYVTTGSGYVELDISDELVDKICTTGSNDAAVEEACAGELREQLDKYSAEQIQKAFDDCGIDMTDEERESLTRQEKEHYIVWCLAWNLYDER